MHKWPLSSLLRCGCFSSEDNIGREMRMETVAVGWSVRSSDRRAGIFVGDPGF